MASPTMADEIGPYLPNYWEFDLPPAATTRPGPSANIRNTRSAAASPLLSIIFVSAASRPSEL
eukprot:scaffold138109_cov22-Cyclotella_meneghiniana.AAC.1